MTTLQDPPTEELSVAAPPLEESGGFFRRILSHAGNWRELRTTPYGLRPAMVLSLLYFFGRLDARGFTYASPDIARDLDISLRGIVTLIQIILFMSIFAGIFVGWYADRHPRLRLVGLGAIFSGIFSMLTSNGKSSVSLGAPLALDEVAEEVGGVPRLALLADYYPAEERGKVFALTTMARNAGELAAPLVVGYLIVTWGWRGTFFVWGIPMVILGILVLVTLREPVRGFMERKAMGADEEVANKEDEAQSFGEAWRTTWAVRTIRRLMFADVFSYGAYDVVGVLLPFYLAERYELNALARGLVLIPGVAIALLAGYVGGGLVDYFTRHNPVRVLGVVGVFELVAAVGWTGVAVEPPLWMLVASLAVAQFGLALVGPALRVIYAQVLPPAVRVQGLQMTRLAEIPATLLFLNISGILVSEYGYSTTFLAMMPFFILAALLILSAASFFDLDMRNAYASSLAAEEFRRARAEGRGKLLVCRDVDVEYDGVQVLFGVDFDVDEGEIVALLGTNGAGKSTLLRAIAGSQEASAGAIVFDGRDTTHMPPNEIAQRGVITMPGGRGVFPGLTVRENLMLGNWMEDDEAEVRARLAEVFEMFPVLRERSSTAAASLSGGEQQMLSLAQAFLARPRLLMIDELSLGLSPAVVGQLLEVVRAIHARGTTIIVVEQSVNVALTLAQRAIFMEKGEVRFFGATADLLTRPDILRAVYVKGTGALTSGAPASALRSERERRSLELGEARPILEVSDVVKRYGGVTAVDGVSLELREGEVLGLIGPNGSGKTTLFDLISGYQRVDAGAVRYDGVDVSDLGPEERARRGLVRRFQDARLFSSLTVHETLLVALEQRMEVRSTFLSAFSFPAARRSERRARQRADRLVELLELGSYRDKFVKELSTGLRRIVDLACVLGAEPRVLLLDEPSSGIAQAEAESLGPLLRRIRYETGCSILIIEHDMPLISAVSDELVALEMGQVVVRGTPEAVLNDERVIEAYLGTSEEAVRRSGSLA